MPFYAYRIHTTVTAGQDREKFERLRWVELKHGRIAMLAVVGKYLLCHVCTYACSMNSVHCALIHCAEGFLPLPRTYFEGFTIVSTFIYFRPNNHAPY